MTDIEKLIKEIEDSVEANSIPDSIVAAVPTAIATVLSNPTEAMLDEALVAAGVVLLPDDNVSDVLAPEIAMPPDAITMSPNTITSYTEGLPYQFRTQWTNSDDS